MAWYYGTFACGHKGSVNIIGKESERKWKIDRAFSGLCEDCKAKERVEKFRKDVVAAKEYDFPELSGSPKQINWGISIRAGFYNYCDAKNIDVDNIIQNETSAKFWIDNRGIMNNPEFVNYYNKAYEKKQLKKQVQEQIVGIDTVKPPVINHGGVVEIVERKGQICLKYEKDEDFIKLVKLFHYKWSASDLVWSRKLSETVGTFEDRAAEIGHALLKNGFCISIHDEKAKEKAISGDYTKEHTKWIFSRSDTSLLAINWRGKDDRLYGRAREIEGSRWDSPSVVVDVSHYKEILQFAAEENFRFTKKAEQKIEDYINQMRQTETASSSGRGNEGIGDFVVVKEWEVH